MKPTPEQVKELRLKLQALNAMNITTAQDECAAMLHTSRRAWQQWETGDRGMHSAFWELARIKFDAMVAEHKEVMKA